MPKTKEIISRAYDEALVVLRHCTSPIGFKASARVPGYPQVWGRDSMITALGVLLTDDMGLIDCARKSIETLRRRQTAVGLIPNAVDLRTGRINFQAYMDGGAWFVIGNWLFFKRTNDKSFLKRNYRAVKKVLEWYEYQKVDGGGLVSMQEGSDWEDLFATRGKGLYVNVLYYWALKAGEKIARSIGDDKTRGVYVKAAKAVKNAVNDRLWFYPRKDTFEIIQDSFGTESFRKRKGVYLNQLGRPRILPKKTILHKASYYLPYVSFRDFGEWFDTFGNLLAILTGIADRRKTRYILRHIERFKLSTPYPIKAISPPIRPGGKDWRDYYRFGNLNLPNQYHNGGIWPFLGGFYVAALVKARKLDKARRMLLLLAELDKKGKAPWEFNEWFHSKTAQPKGMAEQAWSTGMYIYAYESVFRKKAPRFI